MKKILDALRQSLANDYPKKIDDIIVHVFSTACYRTGNHNRHNVLGKTLYNHVVIPNSKLYCLFWKYTLDIFHVLQLFHAQT